jgi:hypothetical protein
VRDIDDRLQNSRAISQYIRIPKPQNAITIRFKPPIAFDIAAGIRMLTAVHFNDQTTLMTCEVDDVSADRRLTPKA